jgi:hypothetical protein
MIPNKFKHRKFFGDHDEYNCYSIEHHIDFMRKHEIKAMRVYLAEREVNTPYFYCRKFGEVGDKTQSTCGSNCKAYSPRNKKSGICEHSGYVYEKTDVSFWLFT